MEEATLDWVDCSLFLMIASAEVTDHYLDEQEIMVIIEKAKLLVSSLSGSLTLDTGQDIEKKFKKTFDRYIAIGDAAPQDQMDLKIMAEFDRAATYLKDREWFNPAFARSLIKDLIDIAKADGEVIKNEMNTINKIGELWGVENPFH